MGLVNGSTSNASNASNASNEWQVLRLVGGPGDGECYKLPLVDFYYFHVFNYLVAETKKEILTCMLYHEKPVVRNVIGKLYTYRRSHIAFANCHEAAEYIPLFYEGQLQ